MTWITPNITSPGFYYDMTEQAHILIAGTTGAGKSVALNGLVKNLLRFAPSEIGLILIDPKGVELKDFAKLPHTISHHTDIGTIEKAITHAFNLMETRFQELAKTDLKRYPGKKIYILIDEYMDLSLRGSKNLHNQISNIASKGRAAEIHLIICTQRPCKDTLPPLLKDCLTASLALTTAQAQQSIYMVGHKGLETLPKGIGVYTTPTYPGEQIEVNIPLVTDEEMKELVTWWTDQAKTAA